MLDTASKRVLVGMSGGVDSSVCVKLLREEGFVVEGAVIRFSPAHEGAVEQARQVAAQLDVPLRVLDCCAEFETSVIQPFCESYCHGKTPNPCILCNPRVKFSALARAANDMGIHCIASGHYARIAKTDRGFAVQKAVSTARDQSYMLYRLSQDILARLLLPLGAFEKPEIRAMAHAMGLCCADAPDSQEICFIPDGDYASYIAQRGGSWLTGHFIAPDGTDLGAHKGVVHYTVGQRKGLGLSLNAPAFIKRIRKDGNIELGFAGEEFYQGVRLSDVVAADRSFVCGDRYTAKIRSVAAPVSCTVGAACGDSLELHFDVPARAPAPGQSAVLYREDLVVGGGIIDAML